MEVDGEADWEGDYVLVVRKYRGKLQYRIKWLGYGDGPDRYPASDLSVTDRVTGHISGYACVTISELVNTALVAHSFSSLSSLESLYFRVTT